MYSKIPPIPKAISQFSVKLLVIRNDALQTICKARTDRKPGNLKSKVLVYVFVVSVRVLHATAMCREGACSLMMLVVVLHPMIAASQRTLAHRYDDSHVDVLMAMVSRLQDTVERQHQHCLDSVNQQQEYLAKLENILLSVKEDVTNVQESTYWVILIKLRLYSHNCGNTNACWYQIS